MDLLNSLPPHYSARHRYYCRPNIVPDNLEWLCDYDLPNESNATVYNADKNLMVLYIWWKNKPIVKINLTVTVPGDNTSFKTNVYMHDLRANTITQAISESDLILSQILNLQGFKISLNS